MKKLFFMLLGLMPAATSSSANDAGTTSPFALGAGSRELASGGAGLAVTDGATAAYWNPAGLIGSERASLSGLHAPLYETGAVYQYLGFVWPTLDFGTFGVGVFRLGIGGIEERDENNFLLGEIDDSRLAFYLAYGREMSGYQVGAAVHMEHHALGGYTASSSPGLTLALGRRFDFNSDRFRSLSLVAVGRNIIRPGIRLAETTVQYPMTAELGISLEIVPRAAWEQAAVLSVKLSKTDYVKPRLSVGLDYPLGDLLAVRGGLREGEPSAGLGIGYGSVQFDYALVDRELGSLHLFTLSSSFGGSVTERRAQRARTRETEFNNLMSDRLLAGKREMVGDLIAQGKAHQEAGDLVAATDFYDRALFMARSVGMDTVVIAGEYRQMMAQLGEVERKYRFRLNLDSAQVRVRAGDYLGAQYFANLALEDEPTSHAAGQLLSEATAAIEATTSRAERVSSRLATADSLLSGGRFERARAMLKQLMTTEPGNQLVRMTYKRAVFEQLRDRASIAYNTGALTAASNALDSALVMFPDHQWCLDMRRRLGEVGVAGPTEAPEVISGPAPEKLSRELRREVETTYSAGMDQFKSGQLTEAISRWERVERLAADYKSVRKYLVNAYKFVGVEEYGQGNLVEAVAVWEKALRLDTGNREIIGYLERARTEITKLREFSYDNQ